MTGFSDQALHQHSTGTAPDTPPHAQLFWVAPGFGSLTWTARPGDWTAVVMNADGSRAVDTPVVATATLPALALAAWTALGAGAVLLFLGGGLLLFAATRPTVPARTTSEGATREPEVASLMTREVVEGRCTGCPGWRGGSTTPRATTSTISARRIKFSDVPIREFRQWLRMAHFTFLVDVVPA